MKNIFTLTLAAITLTMLFAIAELKAQDSQDSKIGLTVGIDYVSNYLYRGEYFYSGILKTGMFSPYATYHIFNTGLSVSIRGEVSDMWIWNQNDESLYQDIYKMLHSIGYNINYMYELKKLITFNLGGWYYSYQTLEFEGNINLSYFDIYFSAKIDALPFAPRLIVTYSYFMDEDYARGAINAWGEGPGKNGDLYVQFGFGHSFEIFRKTYFDIEAIAGFYNKNSSGFQSMLAEDGLTATNSADISDIDLSAGFTTTASILTFSTSFHYVIVPGTQYKHTITQSHKYETDIHRFYTKFGVSCSI